MRSDFTMPHFSSPMAVSYMAAVPLESLCQRISADTRLEKTMVKWEDNHFDRRARQASVNFGSDCSSTVATFQELFTPFATDRARFSIDTKLQESGESLRVSERVSSMRKSCFISRYSLSYRNGIIRFVAHQGIYLQSPAGSQ